MHCKRTVLQYFTSLGKEYYREEMFSKVKQFPQQAMEAYRVEMLRIPHRLDSSQIAERLSALAALCHPETLLFFCFCYSFLLEAE
jgi:hypothetical protein